MASHSQLDPISILPSSSPPSCLNMVSYGDCHNAKFKASKLYSTIQWVTSWWVYTCLSLPGFFDSAVLGTQLVAMGAVLSLSGIVSRGYFQRCFDVAFFSSLQ